jgi:hypothetical protein
LGLYYVVRFIRGGEWQGMAAFALVSLVLHGAAAVFWYERFGIWVPAVSQPGLTYGAGGDSLAVTYPISAADLPGLFLQWPAMIFRGSDLGTTLFGYVPFLVLGLAVAKGGAMLRGRTNGESVAELRLDRWDVLLGVYVVAWFVLLNFLPHAFRFDRYYSMPRIFRYLAPLSFPLCLLAAKLVLDLSRALRAGRRLGRATLPLLATLVVTVNVLQALETTSPGRRYRRVLGSVVAEITRTCPTRVVVAGPWLSRLMQLLWLRDVCGGRTALVVPTGSYRGIHRAEDYERWLGEAQRELPEDAMLMTGYFDYLYYNYDDSGFYLTQFARPLDDRWQLVKTFGSMDPTRLEPVRLWQWRPATQR